MPVSTTVVIINFPKRKVTYKYFTKICEAIAFMKTYTRGKDCFIYAHRNGEVLAIKSDLCPMKVYDRSSDYEESFEFEDLDNHRIAFNFTITPTIPRYGFPNPKVSGLF